jgi:thioredoxin 1
MLDVVVAIKQTQKKNHHVDAMEETVVSELNQPNDQQKESTSMPLGLRVLIGVVIVCVVIGIYFFKNSNGEKAEFFENNTQQALLFEEEENDFGVSEFQGADFDLHVEATIDLDALKSYNLPIIIDFGADSCIPCKEMAPVLVKLNKEFEGKAIIKFVDVWKYQELSEGYPIKVIPTQVFFDKNSNPFTPTDPQKMQMTMYETNDTNEHIFTVHEGGMSEDMIREVLKEMGVE